MQQEKIIVERILEKEPNVVGVYRLSMKENADNFRYSAILDIIKELENKGVEVIVYEPILTKKMLQVEVVNNIKEFIKRSSLIIANRWSDELNEVKNKIYTRDLFRRD